MRTGVRMSAALLLACFFVLGCSRREEVPVNKAVPKLRGTVNDYYGLLDKTQQSQLDEKIVAVKNTLGAQIVIIIIDSTGKEPIEEYTQRVAKEWGIDEGRYHDWVLMTVAVQDKKIRIDAGRGLQKFIPNETVKDILDKDILPKFETGAYTSGMYDGVGRIAGIIAQNKAEIYR